MSNPQEKKALVLSGGGARASYQVGVLRAIANLLPKDSPNPFQIITGTSAGGLNAASLATHAQRLRTGVRTLEYVWGNIDSSQIYKLDSTSMISNASNWVFSFLANRRRNTPTSLLDNEPLEALLAKVIKFGRIQRSIDAGYLEALAITASGYTSGESVSFFQGASEIENWQRSHRVGLRTELNLSHLMASTAIPTLFPAVRINREYFGDGAIRQLAPLSPAIHLGANRILAVGVGSNKPNRPPKDAAPAHPSLTQILSHILNSAFVDTLPSDLETMRRVNTLVSRLNDQTGGLNTTAVPDIDTDMNTPVGNLRRIDLLAISPSQNLNNIASEHFDDLPRALRLFINDSRSSAILSLLLFENTYCQRLIDMGFKDAMEKETAIVAFFKDDQT